MGTSGDFLEGNIQSNYLRTLIENYRSFSKGSAESILGQAETLKKAEDELADKHLSYFYDRTGLKKDGSTARKLRKIGEKRSRLEPHLEVLPNTWTTLYALARMNEEQFEELVSLDVLHPFLTMKEINHALGKSRGSDRPRKFFRVNVDLARLEDEEDRERVKKEINEVLVKYGLVQLLDKDTEEALRAQIKGKKKYSKENFAGFR